MLTTIRNKLAGFADSLAFSNRASILFQRLFRPGDPLVSYCWKEKWWLVCDARFMDAHAAKEVLARGCYQPWIRRSVRDGRLAYVNVGANIGAFDVAVAAEAAIPAGLSVELNPRTFVRLNFNLEINGLLNVRTLNAGIAGAGGSLRFRATECSLGDGLFTAQPSAQDGAAIEVPLFTLDEALTRSGLEAGEFDLLKLDCEGAEYGIVAGASPECLRRFRHIVAELHPEPASESARAFYAKLAECGFRSEQPEWVPAAETALRFWSRV